MAASNGYNMDTVARLLRILRSNSPSSKAKLARLASMNARTLEKYLEGLLVPLGMVEERIGGRNGKKKEYVITPLGVMASILMSMLYNLFSIEQYELKKRIVRLVEEELRSRGLIVRNLLATRCSLSTPADLLVSDGERSALLYIALDGDEAVVKSIIGLGASVLSRGRRIVIVAAPEKPCINLDNGRGSVRIIYYDLGNPAGAAKEIARSVEHVLLEEVFTYTDTWELGALRI